MSRWTNIGLNINFLNLMIPMTRLGSHYYICEGNIYRRHREGSDVYVFWKKLEDNKKDNVESYFNEIEEDFRLLHKPFQSITK